MIIQPYTKGKFVGRAIDSLLRQTFRDFKLIVVNDESTDNGPDVVHACSDPRVRLVTRENQGVCVARNEAIEEVKADIVAFLDAAYGAVNPGDLLTTSPGRGHAMKVMDHGLAQGAIIGKTMSALPSAKGLALVLASLQFVFRHAGGAQPTAPASVRFSQPSQFGGARRNRPEEEKRPGAPSDDGPKK